MVLSAYHQWTMQYQLFLCDRLGGNLRRLTLGGWAMDPAWSPDGRSIAYVRLAPKSGAIDVNNIWSIDLVTGRESSMITGWPNPCEQ